jgi:hypothetical protein
VGGRRGEQIGLGAGTKAKFISGPTRTRYPKADSDAGRRPGPVDCSAVTGTGRRRGRARPDGSGKTTFAAELAAAVRLLGRPAVGVSLDDFHNVRAVRYRQGRESPQGFWLGSYNYRRP